MECTVATPAPPTAAAPEPLVTTPSALLAAFASIPDPRRRQGIRFSLPAVLALALAAILAKHLSVLAIAEWGAGQSQEVLRRLGFPQGKAPHQSTIQRLFKRLDPARLSQALARAFATHSAPDPPARGSQGVAVDGKAQCGRLAADPTAGSIHALSAFCHEQGLVLAQEPITSTTEKAEAELTVAPRLLDRLDWRGRVLTGDALFCQRSLCQQVLAAGGDYLLLVKDNQPTLHEDLRLVFDPPFPAHPLEDRREACTVDRGHGRRQEVRHLTASTDLVGYTDWPGLAQAVRLERTWRERGQDHQVVQYGITSLPPEVADADRLLELKRGHWHIENKLHYVKDVTLGEDRSLVHVGKGPAVMSMLRDTALTTCCAVRAAAPSLPACASTVATRRLSLLSSAPPRTHKPWVCPYDKLTPTRRPIPLATATAMAARATISTDLRMAAPPVR